MVESYRFKSKLTTGVCCLCSVVSMLGVAYFERVLPPEFVFCAPLLVTFAGYVASQYTENTRVSVAEELAVEEYKKENPSTIVVGNTMFPLESLVMNGDDGA